MPTLGSLDKEADKLERFFKRQWISADESALKLLRDIEHHIDVMP